MGRFIDDGENHFRIEYRTPIGGVDTSAPPQFIDGSKLIRASNVLIRDGAYTPSTALPLAWGAAGSYNPTFDFIGFGELPFIGTSGGGQYNAAGYFYITATYSGGNATVTAWQGGDLTDGVLNIGSVTLPCLGTLGRLTFITINQVVYLSAPGLTGILQLTLVIGSVTFAFQLSLLTANLGCSYLREMNGRLLAMNVWQVDPGPPSIVINFPYQVAWSADSEQYGIWDVLDGSGNPTGAGFNNLPDVEDVITGAVFEGPTGYIYRQQGITEVVGLNSGIQPFQFEHLWASYKGIGTVYPNTLDQYGSESAFLSDGDVYSMGVQGLTPISGTAKQAIYATLYASNNNAFGLMCPVTYNGEPEMYYILIMQPITPVLGAFQTIYWMYSYTSKEWTQFLLVNGPLQPIKDVRAMQKLLADGVTNANLATGILPVFAAQTPNSVPHFYYLPDPANSSSTISNLVFPLELIAPFRDVTIDGIAVYTPQEDGSTIALSINGVAYQTITVDGISNQCVEGYYKSFKSDESAASTFQNSVQLTMQIIGTAQVGHIVLYGTQTPSRPF
jgi:hypothetical protein